MKQKKFYSHIFMMALITTLFVGCNSSGDKESNNNKGNSSQQKSIITSENYIDIAKFQYQKSNHVSIKIAQRKITESQKKENLRQKASASNQKNSLYVRQGQNSMHIRNVNTTVLVNFKKDADIVTVTLYEDKKVLKSSDIKYSDFISLSKNPNIQEGETL